MGRSGGGHPVTRSVEYRELCEYGPALWAH